MLDVDPIVMHYSGILGAIHTQVNLDYKHHVKDGRNKRRIAKESLS